MQSIHAIKDIGNGDKSLLFLVEFKQEVGSRHYPNIKKKKNKLTMQV